MTLTGSDRTEENAMSDSRKSGEAKSAPGTAVLCGAKISHRAELPIAEEQQGPPISRVRSPTCPGRGAPNTT